MRTVKVELTMERDDGSRFIKTLEGAACAAMAGVGGLGLRARLGSRREPSVGSVALGGERGGRPARNR
jgi:hypothetical protein